MKIDTYKEAPEQEDSDRIASESHEYIREQARSFCERAMDPANGILGIIASGHPEADGFERHLDATVPHIRCRPNIWPPKNQVALA